MKAKRVNKKIEEQRKKLIKVAQKLFIENSYADVSVRDILKEVKAAPEIFYHYFESKKQIFDESISELTDELLEKRSEIFLTAEVPIMKKVELLIQVIINDQKKYSKILNKVENNDIFFWELKKKLWMLYLGL